MKRYVIGDIHGELIKLKSLLGKINFDYESDFLISLGDLVDRGEDSMGVILELIRINNLVSIKGNHDQMFYEWFNGGKIWDTRTATQYLSLPIKEKNKIINFLNKQILYYADKDRLFVHAGVNENKTLAEQSINDFTWNNIIVENAIFNESFKLPQGFNTIFVGHTPTFSFGDFLSYPQLLGDKIWCMDTGACYDGGKLSIMNIDSMEIFQI